MKRIIKKFTPVLLLIAIGGCKKDYLETKPGDGVPNEQILAGSYSAISGAVQGSYNSTYAFNANGAGDHDDFGQKAIDLAIDLMGNDMVVHTQGYGWFNADYNYTEWSLATQNTRSGTAWTYYYKLIGGINAIISSVDQVKGIKQAEKENILGQALGIRAYAYFYLVNLWQQTYKGNESKPGVPLVTTVSLEGKPRSPVQDVYDQIIKDLTDAEALLTGKPRTDKNVMDVSVIQGFRARAALMMEDWATAATYANKARQSYPLMSQADYAKGFSDISNPEWMWGAAISADQSTIYASFFSHIDITNVGYASLGGEKKITKALYDQIPTGDVRKTVFTPPGTADPSNPDYNQLKFRVPNPGSWAADYLYMRASEMYLIEAEALARQNQDAQAATVLQTLVKARYPAYSAAGLAGADLLNEILLQRRIELWGEGWGLLDIKRLKTGLNRPSGPGNHGAPNYNPGVYKTGPQDPRFLLRIPKSEIDANENLTDADQNPS